MRRSGSRAVINVGAADTPKMEGYLYKKNKSGGGLMRSSWSKRWVWINDERGRMHLCRKKGQEGSTVFSLSEVSVIESLDPLSPDADGSMFCIKVVQAPLSVVLRCRDENERKRWLSALQVRSARWVDTRGAELAENKLTAAAVIKGGASAPSPAYAPYAPKAALPDYLTSTSTQSLKSAPSTLANSDDSDDDSSHTDADTRFFNSFQVDADEARRGVEADEMTEVVSLS